MSTEAVSVESVPSPRSSAPWWKFLYNHNPFYAISTVLMLISVQAAYGEMPIGEINCWLVMIVLGGYACLLAVIGVCIIRFGKIWEDARSVLLLILLLFLAISVSMDDLFVKFPNAIEGAYLAAGGFGFAFVLTEAVLFLTQIQFRIRYRIPYYLFLLLFFFTPWYISPELHPRSAEQMEWLLFLFSLSASGIILSLWPAVLAGPKHVSRNGTPWKWPVFPWSIFAMLILATMIRSYALCLTFGPTGPIWTKSSMGTVGGIVFSTIWGAWFLVPMLWAILFLLLEGGVVTHSRRQTGIILKLVPLLLLFSLPFDGSIVFKAFWSRMLENYGSPVWLTCCLMLAFYTWAWIRKVQGAHIGIIFGLLLLTRIGPETDSLRNLTSFQVWPLYLIGAGLLIHGLRSWSPSYQFFGWACLSWVPLLLNSEIPDHQEWAFGMLWLSTMLIGLVHRDDFALLMRCSSALLMCLFAGYFLFIETRLGMSDPARVGITMGLALLWILIGYLAKSQWYYIGFCGNSFLVIYFLMSFAYRLARDTFGATAMVTFCWSVGMLLCAMLISAHKAKWLRMNLITKIRD